MKKKLLIPGIVVICILLIIVLTLYLPYLRITLVTNGDPIPRYENPKKALLVIDIQKNLTSKDGKWILNLNQSDKMINKINSIIKASSEEKGLLVIYISNEFSRNSIINKMTDGAMEENTEGAKIDERILIINDNHFIKNKMDAFSNEMFEDFLKKNKINHLLITGIDAEDCVDKTIKGALNRNYKITVISNAIATKTDEGLKNKISDFREMGAEVISTDELLKTKL